MRRGSFVIWTAGTAETAVPTLFYIEPTVNTGKSWRTIVGQTLNIEETADQTVHIVTEPTATTAAVQCHQNFSVVLPFFSKLVYIRITTILLNTR